MLISRLIASNDTMTVNVITRIIHEIVKNEITPVILFGISKSPNVQIQVQLHYAANFARALYRPDNGSSTCLGRSAGAIVSLFRNKFGIVQS